ncbi:hypothetical protein K227x_07100 [Rubripirellula lacrimiformis]|uniref:Uncharacterized protein n=1 Tax=Rubripirellula lacrimiformis TaxID=1930273 RepID=A0A517N5D3_9BACT|nr:hypothetical protein [Rubripirellula lacrimiformis]QDT02334.1 hypothetical protein K227x_07100 [Rubripirellula lacrimiformis]
MTPVFGKPRDAVFVGFFLLAVPRPFAAGDFGSALGEWLSSFTVCEVPDRLFNYQQDFWVSYQWLVRYTPIGKLLNGKRARHVAQTEWIEARLVDAIPLIGDLETRNSLYDL